MGQYWSQKYNEQYDFAQASNEEKEYKAEDTLSRQDVPNILKSVSVLSHLTDEQITTLIQCMRIKKYKYSEVICNQGDVGDNFYLICKGRVNVLIDDTRRIGQQKKVATLKTGDTFGETALVTSNPRNATIQCDMDVKVMYTDKFTFLAITNTSNTLNVNHVHSKDAKSAPQQEGVPAVQPPPEEVKDEEIPSPLPNAEPDPVLLQKLQDFGLSKWYSSLNQKLGVETLSDLQYCSVHDFQSIGCKPVQIRKLQEVTKYAAAAQQQVNQNSLRNAHSQQFATCYADRNRSQSTPHMYPTPYI